MKRIWMLILFLSLSQALEFSTKIGVCELKLQKPDKDLEIKLMERITSGAEKMVQEFGQVPSRKFQVFIARSEDEFIKMTRGTAPEWSVAIARRNPPAIILKSPEISPLSFYRFMDVVIHELNHIYIHRIRNNATMPAWFVEGLAMRSAGEFSIMQKVLISQAKWRNQLIPLSRLYSMRTRSSTSVDQAYAQAASAVNAMEYYYGSSVFSLIFNTMNFPPHGEASRVNMDFSKAFQFVTGDDQLDFQEKYNEFIRMNYNWLFLLQASSLIFIALPVILVIGFILKRKKSRRKMELWQIEEDLEQLVSEENPGETESDDLPN